MKLDASTEVFMVMKIDFVVFWVVTLCGDVFGYLRFRGGRKDNNPEGYGLN
jgi:hypothetical protein